MPVDALELMNNHSMIYRVGYRRYYATCCDMEHMVWIPEAGTQVCEAKITEYDSIQGAVGAGWFLDDNGTFYCPLHNPNRVEVESETEALPSPFVLGLPKL